MRHTWHSLRFNSDRSVAMVAFLCTASVAFCGTAPAQADDARSAPLAVPVKVLPDASEPSKTSMPDNGAAQPQRPQPTLPGGKLPQYQLDSRHRAMPSPEELEDSAVRFLLALPSRPLVVEARITIDGRPFRMVRESRIDKILKAASQPVSEAAGQEAEDSGVNDDAINPNPGAAPVPQTPDAATDNDSPQGDDDGPENDSSTEADDEEENPPDTDEPEREPVAPPTETPYALPTTAADYVRRYLTALERDVSADEVRWLLTNQLDGPVLLMLNDHFQRFRADQRPVFDVLDRNRDGVVSADELENAVTAFQECDRNRDDIVDFTEIGAAADASRRRESTPAGVGRLIFTSPDAISATRFSWASAERPADSKEGRRLDTASLQALWEGPPDVLVTVAFNTADSSRSTLELTQTSAVLEEAVPSVVGGSSLALTVDGTPLEFSAIQRGASDQVSIGAVFDGYPMLPTLDPNDDGRLTIRELRQLVGRLRAFDGNHDGRLTTDEVQAPLRVCFGLGPLVHQELASIRSVNRPAKSAPVTGPDWFVRMDRNDDNDLTRNEFPGTDEQFAALDADGDQLISAEEAADFERRSQTSEPNKADKPQQDSSEAASPSDP